jgi:glycosyltransferase involved in cell wall biosynthesis
MTQRILVLSRTPIGRRMSSPGIRYLNLTRVLREALPDAEVVLASPPVPPEDALADVAVEYYEPVAALHLTRRFDVVIAMTFPMSVVAGALLWRRPVLVLDFFSQFFIEWMEAGRDRYRGLHRRLWTRAGQLYLNLQLTLADYLLCANERQRDAYVGVLGALGRLTPAVYDAGPTLRSLIDVAPHGVRPESPPTMQKLREGAVPGIGPDDRLLLWLGGILHWYDPSTLLRAMSRLQKTHPEAKLLFLGAGYPDGSRQGQGRRYRAAVEECERLGLLGKTVFFEERWLPHDEVVHYLRAAEIGVTTYFNNAETRFAHRTRLLDYIWAGVPIVCTRGDVLADEVARESWGIAVRERDEDALAKALTRLLESDSFASRCRTNLARARKSLSWEAAFEPLIAFLRSGAQPAREGHTSRRGQVLRSMLAYGAGRLLERVAKKLDRV